MKTCVTCKSTHARGLFCDHGHVLKDEESEDILLGRVLEERYEVRAALGGGGFGMVYLGAQLRLEDRPCVIKVARPELAQDAQFAARFQREKKALMALRSRNTVQILDYGRTDDAIDYIVMEFIEGDELGRLLRRSGPMQPSRVISLARGICNSLIEAHGAGILHRDLKPGNVMLVDLGTSELVKVIDFGIARLAGGEADGDFRTATGELPGTPAYSPYEQLIGQTQKVDERADIYSFGAILYEALTGVVPYGDRIRNRDYDSSTLYFLALAQAKGGEAPTPPGELITAPIPPLLEQLVVCMLHKTREERPASAQEVLDILQRVERINATGSSTIEADETVIAPLSEAGSIAAASSPSAPTPGDESETPDSDADESPTAPPDAPSEQPPTASPDVDLNTRPRAGVGRGILWGGGATITVLLVVLAFLLFGPQWSQTDANGPQPPGPQKEEPVSANPAGITKGRDVILRPDVIARADLAPADLSLPLPDLTVVDEKSPPEVTRVVRADLQRVSDLRRTDIPLTDVDGAPQDMAVPPSEDLRSAPPEQPSPEQLRNARKKREERRKRKQEERRRMEAEKLKKEVKETPKEVEEPSETGNKETSDKGGASTAVEGAEEKKVEVKKEDPKAPVEEKKALHERLDFMGDNE